MGNTGSQGGGLLLSGGCNATLIISILWGNSPHEIMIGVTESPDSVSISYSDVFGGLDSIQTNENGIITWGTGNINVNPLFCDANSGDYTLAANSPCVGTGENRTNMGSLGIGCSAILAVEEEFIPMQFSLHQNYPNPFNPVTTLRYAIPENGLVTITIYDMLGREVKTLINQTQDAGYRSVIWNATNDYGNPVSAGIYLYQIQTGEYLQTKKMVLLK